MTAPPLAGIRVLRLYENELARQTQAALIAQGAYAREHFRQKEGAQGAAG